VHIGVPVAGKLLPRLPVDRGHGGHCARVEHKNIRVDGAQSLWRCLRVRNVSGQRLDAGHISLKLIERHGIAG